MKNYTEFINIRNQRIENFKKAIVSGEVKADRLYELKSAIFDATLYKTIALYSSEANKEQVTASLLEAIAAFEAGFHWEGFAKSYAMYDQMIWMLSLGILCDLEVEDFKRIVAVIQRGGATDTLIKTLVNYRLPGAMTGSSYIQKSPYESLNLLVIGQDKQLSFIKQYLDKKWYQGHKAAPWYDSHKRTKVNTYFGYWAWEVGALVKIYNIDDSSLNNQQYYPFRAVHW